MCKGEIISSKNSVAKILEGELKLMFCFSSGIVVNILKRTYNLKKHILLKIANSAHSVCDI